MEKTNIYKKLFEVKKAGIKLQRDTKAFNYQYATLSQIQEKLNGEFEKQELLIIHSVKDNKVNSKIIDIENEASIESEIEMTEGIKAQDKGSEITYYRRYNLLSLLDLEVEDDDGKKAQDSKPSEKAYNNEKKEWYNDTAKHIDKWTDLVATGKTTGKELLQKVTDGGKKSIKNVDKELILGLDK